MNILLFSFIFAVAFNLFLFIPAFLYKTDSLTDISYALTFLSISMIGFISNPKHDLNILVVSLVWLWGLRLGFFLLSRIRAIKKDSRFDGQREHFWKFIRFWLFQGITVFIILLPTSMSWSSNHASIDVISVVGLIIFAIGITVETVADLQKQAFRRTGSKQWIDQGLWRASRHPNYLGEILVWIGIYIVVFPTIGITGRIIGFVSPAYISCLLLFISGIPPLERGADKRWGTQRGYQQYKKAVPILIPSLHSIKRALQH